MGDGLLHGDLLAFPDHPDPNTWQARATTSSDIAGSPYALIIENGAGGFVQGCYRSAECSANLGPGTYRAAVVEGDERFGASAWYTLDADGTYKEYAAGVDLWWLAQQFATSDELCFVLATAPEPFLRRSTVNSLYAGCALREGEGKSPREILKWLGGAGVAGAAVIWWLREHGGDETITPPAPPVTGGEEDDEPTPLPPIPFDPTTPFERDDFLDRNSDKLESPDQAEDIRNRCVSLVAQVAQQGTPGLERSDCDTMPVFVTAGDYPMVTQHDLSSIGEVPQWIKLTFRPEARNSSPREWYNAYTPCQEAQPRPPGTQCHEFPYYATEEGGDNLTNPTLRPRLDLLPADENSRQGSRYGGFTRRCFDPTASGENRRFLVVPLPRYPTTVGLCNDR